MSKKETPKVTPLADTKLGEIPATPAASNDQPKKFGPQNFNLDKGDVPVAPFHEARYRVAHVVAQANKLAGSTWTSMQSYQESRNAARKLRGDYWDGDYRSDNDETVSDLVKENRLYFKYGDAVKYVNPYLNLDLTKNQDQFSDHTYFQNIKNILDKLRAGERKHGTDGIVTEEGRLAIINNIIIPAPSNDWSYQSSLYFSPNLFNPAIFNKVLSADEVASILRLLKAIPMARDIDRNSAIIGEYDVGDSQAKYVAVTMEQYLKANPYGQLMKQVIKGYNNVKHLARVCYDIVPSDVRAMFVSPDEHHSLNTAVTETSNSMRFAACEYISDEGSLANFLESILKYHVAKTNEFNGWVSVTNRFFNFFNQNDISFKKALEEYIAIKSKDEGLPF